MAMLAPEDLIKRVHDSYSAKARSENDSTGASRVAVAFGYTPEELASIPSEANMGLSCGNPIAADSIKPGEIVLDLGSGGGIDVFLAAGKVGPTGQVIGLDMSKDMIDLARRNAARKNLYPPNVCFVHANLVEPFPLKSDSVDLVISNCVINLLPDEGKAALFKEVARVLKPGGRITLSDVVAKKQLPAEIRDDLALYVGCIGGAIELDKYKNILEDAGLKDAVFLNTDRDLNAYADEGCCIPTANNEGCCGPTDGGGGCCGPNDKAEPRKFDPNEWTASYLIFAVKPGQIKDLNKSNAEAEPASALIRWWDAFPPAPVGVATISREEVVDIVRDPHMIAGVHYAIIDVRGDDHKGGHVRGSFQHRADQFYQNLSAFHEKYAKVPQIIFYCSSSLGRGPRCAGWYTAYLEEEGIGKDIYVLKEGMKGWNSDEATMALVEFD